MDSLLVGLVICMRGRGGSTLRLCGSFVPGRLTGRDGPFDHILLMPMFPDVPLSFILLGEVTEVAKTAGKIILRTERVNTDDHSAHGDLTRYR